MGDLVEDKAFFYDRLLLGSPKVLLVVWRRFSWSSNKWVAVLSRRHKAVTVCGIRALDTIGEKYNTIFVSPEVLISDRFSAVKMLSEFMTKNGCLYFVFDPRLFDVAEADDGLVLIKRILCRLLIERLDLKREKRTFRINIFDRLMSEVATFRGSNVTIGFASRFGGFFGATAALLLPKRDLALPIDAFTSSDSVEVRSLRLFFRLFGVIYRTRKNWPKPKLTIENPTILGQEADVDTKNKWNDILVETGTVEMAKATIGNILSGGQTPVDVHICKDAAVEEAVIWKPFAPLYLRNQLGEALALKNKVLDDINLVERQYPFLSSCPIERLRKITDIYYRYLISQPKVFNVSENSLNNSVQEAFTEAAQNWGTEEKFFSRLADFCVSKSNPKSDFFYNLYCLIQDLFFHHPYFQYQKRDGDIERNVNLLTFSGLGRCGHVSYISKQIFDHFGFKSRAHQLHRHLCTEVYVDGSWRLVDCDAFKGGLFPVNDRKEWASFDDVSKEPKLLDHIPAIGLQLSKSKWGRDSIGTTVEGYVDTGLSWDRPYLSNLYFGGDRIPSRPPEVEATYRDGKVFVVLSGIDYSAVALRFSLGSRSRGWDYSFFPSRPYLGAPSANVIEKIIPITSSLDRLEFDVSSNLERIDKLYLNVEALDSGCLRDKRIHVWPGEEVKICLNR